ncbi:nuclear transport factor 2 family protein [Caulobacter sp. 1776]|uniref:nuclear transport factor 2 family protein n=1 Tax=Caulobacter sp. 1776 TaxID=3156420 RepID=UPI00339B7673
MRSLKACLVIGAALLAAPVHAEQKFGDYHTLPKDLAEAATAYDAAQFYANKAELERLLADDYVLADTQNRNQTKAQFIAEQTAPGSKTLTLSLDVDVQKVWDDGAVLAGTADATGLDKGKPFTVKVRFVDVWAKRAGRWLVVYTQANKL